MNIQLHDKISMNQHKLKKIHYMISIAELTAKTNISRQINDVRKALKATRLYKISMHQNGQPTMTKSL